LHGKHLLCEDLVYYKVCWGLSRIRQRGETLLLSSFVACWTRFQRCLQTPTRVRPSLLLLSRLAWRH